MYPTGSKGVKAEPQSLKAPSTLQNITSYISGISNYVAQSLPKELSSSSTNRNEQQQHVLAPTSERYRRQSWAGGGPSVNSGFDGGGAGRRYHEGNGFVAAGAAGMASFSMRGDQPYPHESLPLPPPQPEQILCAKFAWVNWVPPSSNSNHLHTPSSSSSHSHTQHLQRKRRRKPAMGVGGDPTRSMKLCLLLGYASGGFQVWNVGDTDDIREIVSVREGVGPVTGIEVVPTPQRGDVKDRFAEDRPLIAITTEVDSDIPSDLAPGKPGSHQPIRVAALVLYSLKHLRIIDTVRFEEKVYGLVTSAGLASPPYVSAVKCTENAIIV
ncbi:hypothetical protein HK102_002446, partial [Quaeritorhiza haematococci]